MIEVTGDLWTYPADVRVITTNGTIKRNGECVMGRGCAAEAKTRYPYLPKLLGDKLKHGGNHVYYIGTPADRKFSFPVKHEWMQKADPVLIARSAAELIESVDLLQAELVAKGVWNGPPTVVMPRPGCGNGHLSWDVVRPILEFILDHRFHVITFPGVPR